MAHRIEIAAKVEDTRALVAKKNFESLHLSDTIKTVFLVDVYTIDKEFTPEKLKKIAASLSNPIAEVSRIDQAITPPEFISVIELGFLPGVTDNIATTAKELIEDLLKIKFKDQEDIYTSRKFFIEGNLSNEDILTIANSLYNPLIQRIIIKDKKEFEKTKRDVNVPKVILKKHKELATPVNLDVPDSELEKVGELGIQDPDGSRRGPLALPLPYMKTIQSYFKKLGRNPTDIELESLAQTWSEHCKHTIFADPIDEIKGGLFKTYIKGATEQIRSHSASKRGGFVGDKEDMCVSVFTDNSGIIMFDENYNITHKVETHNSPSALDPFGGSVTGIVGVNRDTIGTGLGAKPIINFYGFCLAAPDDKTVLFRDKALRNPMLSARRIMDGVIAGVNYGGNCSGIPTPQGFLFFHHRYRGKPLVFAGTVGLIPKRVAGRQSYIKKAQAKDYIVMIGGRVGLDGIHGATFSSVGLDTGSPATAVQIGDPITQKKFSDALVRDIRDNHLYSSITDCGAGGLSSAVGETAKQSGGCEVNLEKVPLKYPGLSPWQIWISESQERMILAVPPKNWKKLQEMFKKRGVESTIIGTFTKTGRCVVRYGKKTVMDLSMDFLHNGLPKRHMKTKKPKKLNYELRILNNGQNKKNHNSLFILHNSLKDYNFASYEFIPDQYDHEVQGGSVLKPLQGRGRVMGDASVTRPVLSSQKGIVLSQAMYPEYSEVDPYQMAAWTIDTAIRNAVSAGASLDHLALLDNFCWCSSDEPERLWQLKEAARACYDFSIAYGTPFISGKDSMFNDFKGYDEKGKSIKISVPPTLLISAIGVMKDSSKAVSLDFKFPGDLIYLLGETIDVTNKMPEVDVKKNIKLYKNITRGIERDLIASSQSVHCGGVLIALAKSSMGGRLGVEISFNESQLLNESQGRILVSINPAHKKEFETLFQGNSLTYLGQVRTDYAFIIKEKKGHEIIKTDIDTLLKSYKSTFKGY